MASFSELASLHGVAHGETLAQFPLLAVLGVDGLPAVDHLVAGAPGGRAAADDALDAPASHEVDGPVAGGHHRLPPLDVVLGPGNQGDLLQVVAPVGHVGRNVVVLAVVSEAALVERLPHDLDLLLEELAVGVLVHDGRAEDLDLAGVVAASHAEAHAAVGEPVGGGVVLGQAQGVPHGVDVEAAAEPELLGEVGQVHPEHQQVGDALVALALEVVLGGPEGVVAEAVHGDGDLFGLFDGAAGQFLVGEPAVVGGGSLVAGVVHVDVAGPKAAKSGNHVRGSSLVAGRRTGLGSRFIGEYGSGFWGCCQPGMLKWR